MDSSIAMIHKTWQRRWPIDPLQYKACLLSRMENGFFIKVSEPFKLIKCLQFLKTSSEIIHYQEIFSDTSSESRLPNKFSASISVLEKKTQFLFLLPNWPTISWKTEKVSVSKLVMTPHNHTLTNFLTIINLRNQ